MAFTVNIDKIQDGLSPLKCTLCGQMFLIPLALDGTRIVVTLYCPVCDKYYDVTEEDAESNVEMRR